MQSHLDACSARLSLRSTTTTSTMEEILQWIEKYERREYIKTKEKQEEVSLTVREEVSILTYGTLRN